MEHDKRDNENNTCLRSSVQLTLRAGKQTDLAERKFVVFPAQP